jgi:nucleotide-binding universal stress UspA family protein
MSQIIVGNSLDKYSVNILGVAVDLGKRLGSKVNVIHSDRLADLKALNTIFSYLKVDIQQSYIQNILKSNEELLKSQIKELDISIDELTFRSFGGNADDVLVEQSGLCNADIIVLGHDSNKKLAKTFLGGVTEGVLHKSSASILVSKGNSLPRPRKILLAYDFSYHCNEALDWARKLMVAYNCELEILNVVPCYYEGYHVAHTIHDGFSIALEGIMDESVLKIEQRLDELRESFKNATNVTINTVLDKEGSISNKIVDYVEYNNHDLVILGSHKRGRISELALGSISHKVLRNVKSSVFIAK